MHTCGGVVPATCGPGTDVRFGCRIGRGLGRPSRSRPTPAPEHQRDHSGRTAQETGDRAGHRPGRARMVEGLDGEAVGPVQLLGVAEAGPGAVRFAGGGQHRPGSLHRDVQDAEPLLPVLELSGARENGLNETVTYSPTWLTCR